MTAFKDQSAFSPLRIVIYACIAVFLYTLISITADMSRLHEIPALALRHPATTALIEQRKDEARARKRTLKIQRSIVSYGSISPYLVNAILVAEDAGFWQHHGIDYDGIAHAIRENWKHRRYLYGGSTITQQLAKNLFLGTRKTMTRKIAEFLYAKALEEKLKKRRILELYLNSIEWGPGIYGCEAAARTYFATSAAELSAEQAIRLAAIIINPRRYAPDTETPVIIYRRRFIAQTMLEAGHLDTNAFSILPFFMTNNTTNTFTNTAEEKSSNE
ncbi:MAG: monofunctional biosynthetic peptidoglycan transglycosylase [Spirochaetes bacterium]|nr:monofunctional biosynthetic peptidoglycan transglycosylase [Spirochaetota bacterium]